MRSTPCTVLLLSALLAAQEDTDPLQRRADRLVELALSQNRAYAILEDLVTTAPHRLSGSEGAARAVEWAVGKMEALGFSSVRTEEVMVPRWVRGDVERARIVAGPDGGDPELTILALGGSVGTGEEGIEGEVVVVRTFDQLREMGDAAEDKIVLFNRPMPRTFRNTFRAYGSAVPQRSNGAVEAAKVGAVAALVRSMTTALDDVPHTGAMRYRDGAPEVPAAAVSTVDAERLAAAVEQGTVRVRLELSCRTLEDVPSANVVGELPGTDLADEIVVLGAHLDCWDVGHGAHDDGAGCAHVLEAGRLLQEAGIEPRRTLRFVLYMNEENGLRGARAYVERHRDDLDDHFAAFETDNGGFEPKGFSCSLWGEALEPLKERFDPLRAYDMGALIGGGGGGADIGPLGPHGVILFGMIVSSHRYFDFHHSPRDRIEEVNERELALGAAALAHAVSVVADWEGPP